MAPRKTKKPKIKKLIRDLLPKDNIFSEDEGKMYDDYVDAYLADFDEDELISSDMDDIMNLAMNKILSYRLLQESRTDVDRQIDVAATLEKIDKRNEKLKESLSTRRRDRIDPNELKGFSIVDLAVAYDQDVKRKQLERLENLREEEKELREKRSDYTGNRYDAEKEGENKE
jgi:hypothetical protein